MLRFKEERDGRHYARVEGAKVRYMTYLPTVEHESHIWLCKEDGQLYTVADGIKTLQEAARTARGFEIVEGIS